MPELPEVEVGRIIARRVAAGRIITRVRCADDPIVFDGVAPTRVRRALLGRRVQAVRRHGKHVWFELDRRPWPILHFGMTGGFHTPGGPRASSSSPAATAIPTAPGPRASRSSTSSSTTAASWSSPTRAGSGASACATIPATSRPSACSASTPSGRSRRSARFCELLRGRGAPLKAVLLDQAFAAGVGNWIADEVLYQARLDPRRPRAHAQPARRRRGCARGCGRWWPCPCASGRTAIAIRAPGSSTTAGASTWAR